MSFDVARAVIESFGSRVSFQDRVLSYLFFADLAVVEQSTADAWGSGVTIIGLKGDPRHNRAIIFACCQPTVSFFPSTLACPDLHLCHPVDLYRVVDIFARLAAVSQFDADAHKARIAIVLYRPDPVAATLDDLALSDWLSQGRWILSGMTNLRLLPLSTQSVVVEIFMRCRRAHDQRKRRVRDIISVRAVSSAYDANFPLFALSQLYKMHEEGNLAILEVMPCFGSDLLAPWALEAVVGIQSEPFQPLQPWHRVGQTRATVRLGRWSDMISTVLTAGQMLKGAVCDLWGKEMSSEEVRLVAFQGSGETATCAFVMEVPSEYAEQLYKYLKIGPMPATEVSFEARPVRLSSLGGSLVSLMGPSLEEVLADPAQAAQNAARAYLEAMENLSEEN